MGTHFRNGTGGTALVSATEKSRVGAFDEEGTAEADEAR